MNEIKFSIILPVFNSEKYLSECINSILNQSYENFSLIAVNDGSTDSSKNILENFQKNDSRIKILNQDNGGVSSARNAALHFIQENEKDTDLLCFIDSDDIVRDNFLENYASCFSKNKIDCCVCGYTTFSSSKEIPLKKRRKEKDLTLTKREHVNLIFHAGKFKKNNFQSSGFLTNRCFRYEKVFNIRFNKNISCGEDTLWLIKALEACDSTYLSGEDNYLYRQREGSLSHNNKIHKELIKLFIQIEDTVTSNNLIDYWWNNLVHAYKSNTLKENYPFFYSIQTKFDKSSLTINQRKRIILFKLGYPFLYVFFKITKN